MRFSIIIPLAPERKIKVLESLKNVDYPKNGYEVIVEVGKNPSENRNMGIKKAKGEILVFLDDDCIVDRTLLRNADNFFKKYKDIDLVGGPQLTPDSDPFFAKIYGYAISSFFGTHKMSNRYKKGRLNLNADESYLTSAICFIKKDVFKKVNGFNPKLYPGEDPELFARIKSAGFKLAYSPNLIIYHKRRSTVPSFCKQFFNYGKVAVQEEKTKSTKMSLLFFLPTLFLIYIVLLPFLFILNNLFLLPLAIYLILAIASSVNISLSEKNIFSLPFLPVVYLLLHLSYGFGLLTGLFKK